MFEALVLSLYFHLCNHTKAYPLGLLRGIK
jgi:hypothetical protein